VVNKAPCRVILTAAPPQAAVELPADDPSAPPPGGDPARPEGDEPAGAAR
jgi:hypothetical protein